MKLFSNDTAGVLYPPKKPQQVLLLLSSVLLMLLLTNLAFAHGMSEEEKRSILDGGNLSYLWLGATHMLSGYDHLAFVFGIIFFLTSFRDIAKYVTAFTLGHSVTLIYATFNAIQLNYFIIDAVIGLSVCYIAFANLDGFRKHLNINPPNMMLMIVLLGLIHGFGLSTRLQMLPLNEEQLLLNIISFNVGVELGQVSALALMLLAIAVLRKSHFFQTFSLITNYTLILLGGFLFLMQMHGYEHTTNEELAELTAVARPVAQPATELPQLQQSAWQDTLNITLPPRGELEYKFLVRQGDTFAYEWTTDGKSLFFDFHAEPAKESRFAFQSFDKNTSNSARGALTALFDGTHGWYWKNNSRTTVQVTLKLKGDYTLNMQPADEEIKAEQVYQHNSID